MWPSRLLLVAILILMSIGITNIVLATGNMSERLSLADANAALSASGGMKGKIFAVGNNRYIVVRSRLTGKKGDIFIGEIEIKPLPKHGG